MRWNELASPIRCLDFLFSLNTNRWGIDIQVWITDNSDLTVNVISWVILNRTRKITKNRFMNSQLQTGSFSRWKIVCKQRSYRIFKFFFVSSCCVLIKKSSYFLGAVLKWGNGVKITFVYFGVLRAPAHLVVLLIFCKPAEYIFFPTWTDQIMRENQVFCSGMLYKLWKSIFELEFANENNIQEC